MNSSIHCLAAVAIAMAGSALATRPAPAASTAETNAGAEAPAPGAAAMRAGFDQATGRFRPLNNEELEALRAKVAEHRGQGHGLLRRAGIAPPETDAEAQAQAITLADGSVITPVPMELMVSLEAHRSEDGRLVIRHSDAGLDHAHPQPRARQEHDHE
jgi:hypothetical protein